MIISKYFRDRASKDLSFAKTDEQRAMIAMERDQFNSLIAEKFPSLCNERNKFSPRGGVSVGPGWYPVLYELFQFLQAICDSSGISLEFTQIKEKFGSGRFYYMTKFEDRKDRETGELEDLTEQEIFAEKLIDKLVSEYEDLCDHICAESGVYYDYKISNGWVYDICYEEYLKRFSDDEERLSSAKKCVDKHEMKMIIYEKLQRFNLEDLEKVNSEVDNIIITRNDELIPV